MDPWSTPPTPDELAAANGGGASGVWDIPPTPEELKQAPQVGRTHAAALGYESAIPFASDFHAALTAGARGKPTPEMQVPTPGQLRKLYPGLSYLEAHRQWWDTNQPDVENARRAEQDRQQQAQLYEQAKGEREQLRDAAWDQHPVLYGGGKLAGYATTDYGLGAIAPTASFGAIPKGPLASKLLPAARAGAAQGALYGASEAPTLEDVPLSAARGLEFGAVAGPAGETLGAGLSRIPQRLGRAAEQNALRAVRAPSAVGQLVDREGAARAPAVARAMLDEGLPLKAPGETLAGARDAMNSKYGPAIDALTAEAQQRGASFNLGNVITDFGQRAGEMAKDPQQRPIIDAVQNYLSEVAKARGNWAPAGGDGARQLMQLSPPEAHALRMNLDTFLRGVKRNLDPTGNLTKQTFNGIRQAVDAELGRTMDSAGLGAQWAPANAGYRNMSAAAKLAKAGVKAEATTAAGAGSEGLLAKLRGLKLPGPAPATKAKVQNTLYRLMSPRGPEPSLVPNTAGPLPDFVLWRPDQGEPPIPRDPNAYAPAPAPVTPAPSGEVTPEELARARADVLANHRTTKQLMKRTRKNPPMPEE